MSERFVSLKCQSCGGQLNVYDDMRRFACGYCGTEMVVQRRGGTVALKSATEAIKQVQVGTDKTAAELALVRLNAELSKLTSRQAQIEAQVRERDKSFIEEQFDEGAGQGCLAIIVAGPLMLAFWVLHLLASSVIYLFGFRSAFDWLEEGGPDESEKKELNEIRLATENVRSEIAENRRIVGPSG
jgi:ribosomal protein S27E